MIYSPGPRGLARQRPRAQQDPSVGTREDKLPWMVVSERGQPMTRQAANYIVRVAGETAKLGRVWPHMLRDSCGFYLAGKGTDMRVLQARTPSTRHTTRACPGSLSRACGADR